MPSASQICELIVPLQDDINVTLDHNVSQEHVVEYTDLPKPKPLTQKPKSCGTQTTHILRIFSSELLRADNETVDYFTGLETSAKFSLVLPMAYNLKYRWNREIGLTEEDRYLCF